MGLQEVIRRLFNGSLEEVSLVYSNTSTARGHIATPQASVLACKAFRLAWETKT